MAGLPGACQNCACAACGVSDRGCPDHRQWRGILERLGVGAEEASRLCARAAQNGTDFQTELLATGNVEEDQVFREIAGELDIAYVEDVDAARLLIKPEHAAMLLRRNGWHVPVKMEERSGRTALVVVPERISLPSMKRLVRRHHRLRPNLRIAAPSTLRRALIANARPMLAAQARNELYDKRPAFSARIIIDAWQGMILGMLMVCFALAVSFETSASLHGLHLVFSLFFLFCIGLRFAALTSPPQHPPRNLEDTPAGELPYYAILVALHREAEVVPQLLAALDRLVWPRSKLEVKIVCEADDQPTLSALRARWLPPHVEIVEVPAGVPRTKPKALCYALPLVRSDHLVLYDAEDRPHPLQLLEAWHAFRGAGPDLACVQAPLDVTNSSESRIAQLFAFEYRALFRGLLPFLSGRRVLLPLGGTSNHFRTEALRDVGAWDPYNVTEDADLGIRLFRLGYRTGTISLPTLEDAPTELSVWLPQRTRWFKGWLQTWLVHMRDPLALAADLGWRSFLIAQILMAGLVLSALLHPLLLVALGHTALQLSFGTPSGWSAALLALDTLNIFCGYASFLLLGRHALAREERATFWRIVLWTPPYWMLLSAAAWRAAFHLWRRPHHWEKTPHRRTPAAGRSAQGAAAGLTTPSGSPVPSR
ncbi:MAG: glycosyltransferase [Rhizobiaceae bacterium]|nr:glycosyltransferase [Rhizobiaceae bacterium]